jgi:hypothetical protein
LYILYPPEKTFNLLLIMIFLKKKSDHIQII